MGSSGKRHTDGAVRWHLAKRVSTGLALIAIVSGTGAAASQSVHHAKGITIGVSAGSTGHLRGNHRAVSIPVTIWCDTASVGEIDAIIEQSSTHSKVVRNLAMSCDPQRQRVVLIFEGNHRFNTGTVSLRFDVSAGFGEQFTNKHFGPLSIKV